MSGVSMTEILEATAPTGRPTMGLSDGPPNLSVRKTDPLCTHLPRFHAVVASRGRMADRKTTMGGAGGSTRRSRVCFTPRGVPGREQGTSVLRLKFVY